jgi:hypothetical protein
MLLSGLFLNEVPGEQSLLVGVEVKATINAIEKSTCIPKDEYQAISDIHARV